MQAQRGASHEMFFLDVLLVAPNRTRPPMRVGLQIFEHPHNQALSKVLPGFAQAYSSSIATLHRPSEQVCWDLLICIISMSLLPRATFWP